MVKLRRYAWWLAVVPLFGVLVVSCRPTSEDLEKIARAVPVPAGVTFARVNKFTLQGFGIGANKPEVDIEYSTTLPCAQLRADWIGALTAAHRKFTPSSGSIVLNDVSPYTVIDIPVAVCGHPMVSVH